MTPLRSNRDQQGASRTGLDTDQWRDADAFVTFPHPDFGRLPRLLGRSTRARHVRFTAGLLLHPAAGQGLRDQENGNLNTCGNSLRELAVTFRESGRMQVGGGGGAGEESEDVQITDRQKSVPPYP